MDFDIHEQVMEDGEYLEEAAIAYRERLMEVFTASEEAAELLEHEVPIGWAETLMEYGMGYLGVTPAQMTAEDQNEVLFEIFPAQGLGRARVRPGDGAGVAGLLAFPRARMPCPTRRRAHAASTTRPPAGWSGRWRIRRTLAWRRGSSCRGWRAAST